MKCAKIVLTGIVQGVNFRFFIKQKAEELKITGFAKNNEDRSLEIHACGKNLQRFIEACKKGPSGANVESMDVEEINADYDKFEIRH